MLDREPLGSRASLRWPVSVQRRCSPTPSASLVVQSLTNRRTPSADVQTLRWLVRGLRPVRSSFKAENVDRYADVTEPLRRSLDGYASQLAELTASGGARLSRSPWNFYGDLLCGV